MLTRKRVWAKKRGRNVSSTPTPTLIAFTDTFTRGNGFLQGDVTETGDKLWGAIRLAANNVEIVSNNIVCNSGGWPFIYCDITDGYAIASFTNAGAAGGFGCACQLRFSSTLHNYTGNIANGTGAWTIQKFVDGINTVLASGYSASGSVSMKFEVIGTTLNLYSGGGSTLRLTTTDSSLTRGAIAFFLSDVVVITGVEGGEI